MPMKVPEQGGVPLLPLIKCLVDGLRAVLCLRALLERVLQEDLWGVVNQQ